MVMPVSLMTPTGDRAASRLAPRSRSEADARAGGRRILSLGAREGGGRRGVVVERAGGVAGALPGPAEDSPARPTSGDRPVAAVPTRALVVAGVRDETDPWTGAACTRKPQSTAPAMMRPVVTLTALSSRRPATTGYTLPAVAPGAVRQQGQGSDTSHTPRPIPRSVVGRPRPPDSGLHRPSHLLYTKTAAKECTVSYIVCFPSRRDHATTRQGLAAGRRRLQRGERVRVGDGQAAITPPGHDEPVLLQATHPCADLRATRPGQPADFLVRGRHVAPRAPCGEPRQRVCHAHPHVAHARSSSRSRVPPSSDSASSIARIATCG